MIKQYIISTLASIIIAANCFSQESMIKPVEVGVKTSSFTYIDTKNTANFGNDYGQGSNEVYYKFTITQAMDVKISHCDSELWDTYVHLLDANGNLIDENDDDWEYEYCSNPMNSFLNRSSLPAGTYYVVSEGYSQNGNITTTIQGISQMDVYSQDIGSKASSFSFTDTKNTFNSSNRYNGQGTNDVFYKFTLTRPMDVLISHCGSEVYDTYVHLLGESGNLIDENDDNYEYDDCGNPYFSFLYMSNLAAGTYYVVSEGYWDNGNITTNIQGVRPDVLTSQNVGLDPSTDQNYILTITPTVATTDVSTLSTDQSIQTLQYFDGFGRPVQTVQREITPLRKDIVSTIEYDEVGREYLQWLPTPVADNQGALVNMNDISNVARNVYADSRPFNETILENSPLVIGQKGSGVTWNTKPSTITFQTNASDIANYNVNSSNLLERSTNYSSGMLYKTEAKDEDGKTTIEYKDKLGQVIMKQSSTDVKTYYVYNDFGQLCYVIPPIAADLLGIGTYQNGDDNTILKQYCYLYKYDERGNCIQKRLPGCDWIYMVYDKADRLILTQDGNQRKVVADKNQWTVLKYDIFGRVFFTGTTTDIPVSKTIQNLIDDYRNELITETYTDGSGYSNSKFSDAKPLTVNYYDSYNFISMISDENIKNKLVFDATKVSDYGDKHPSAKGLLTGTRTYILDSSNLSNVSAIYYDSKGQVVQSSATNHLNGFENIYNAYYFAGQIAKTLKVHNIVNQTPIEELYTYFYDHAGRPTITKYKINAKDDITLSSNTYDELGRLTNKLRHTGADAETYSYNIRNWPTKITSGGFEENLYYNSNPVGTATCFNGNISYSTWIYNGVNKGYAYNYDALNRLLDATSKQGTSTQGNGFFNENFTYDKQGNILSLKRKKDNIVIDDLIMHYRFNEQSNQLDYIVDAGGSQSQYNVKEYQNKSTATTNEFDYDENGNMKYDLDRDIVTIRYNLLNLPDIIQFKNGNQIINKYDAGGQKLSTRYFTKNSSTNMPLLNVGDLYTGTLDGNYYGSDYVGNIEYEFYRSYFDPEDPDITPEGYYDYLTLNRVNNPEGYATLIATNMTTRYQYYRRDHLGNNREVWLPRSNGNLTLQRTQYYPSGLPWATTSADNISTQPYKFNGCEFIEMHGLDATDLGNRTVQNATNQFTTMDRFCEKFPWQSPYVHAGNNPANYVDMNGDSISLGNIQNLDRTLGTAYTQNIVNDSQTQTGLLLNVASSGVLSYSKDKNGNPEIATTKDSNGNTVQIGSKTARDFLMKTIDHQDMVTVVNAAKSGVPPGTNELWLGIKQITGFINGSVGLDSKTLGWGMTLLHELHHTNVGGRLSDSPYGANNPGPVETQMNIIRSELNAQGGNYGQRLTYPAIPLTGLNYLPFNNSSLYLVNSGWSPFINLSTNKFIYFK
ncbi:MAG: hypothetical protein GZ091_16290 [Paludibacter sp.]|nr:hypothetical protein [Paludibacter sp.]